MCSSEIAEASKLETQNKNFVCHEKCKLIDKAGNRENKRLLLDHYWQAVCNKTQTKPTLIILFVHESSARIMKSDNSLESNTFSGYDMNIFAIVL